VIRVAHAICAAAAALLIWRALAQAWVSETTSEAITAEVLRLGVVLGRLIRWVGGCFLFCSREAFGATGGFSEALYAGEDIAFCQALKKVGRFVVPKPTVVTSGRKLSVVGPWEVMGLILTIAFRGAHYENKMVLDILYGRRAQDSKRPTNAAS